MFKAVSVNRTESVHGTLSFLFLSHLLYGICVYNDTTTKSTIIDIKRGAAVVSTIDKISMNFKR